MSHYIHGGEIKNAVIKSACILAGTSSVSLSLELHYGGGLHQGFKRGYAADDKRIGWFICEVCRVAGVRQWSELEGKPVVSDSSYSQVFGIAPILGGEWFAPEAD